MNSKTFCIIPWAHTRINSEGTLIPCCKISKDFPRGHIEQLDTFDQWWNGSTLKSLRQDLQQGVKSKWCEVCWGDESAGKPSLRQEYNKRFAKFLDLRSITKSTTYVNDNLPIALDLNLGNLCNFKCLMCSPDQSSRIMAERQRYQDDFARLSFLQTLPQADFAWPDREPFQHWLKSVGPGLRLLELKGGEPLLIKNAISTIVGIENKAQSVISLTTNGSVDFKQEFIDQLAQFQHIWLCVSVDGLDDHAAYIRYGSKWSQTRDTICQLKKLTNCTLRLSTVFQFYSSLTFPEIANFAIEHDLYVEVLLCHDPKFLGINAVRPAHQKKFAQWLDQKIIERPDILWLKVARGYLDRYQFDPVLHEQCRSYTDTMDRVRNNRLDSIQTLFRD